MSKAAQALCVRPVTGIGEIHTGDNLATIIGDAIEHQVQDGDVIVVTSKVVSKSEGRFVEAADREDVITRETVRVVAEKYWPGGSTRIVENRLGLVQAAAGVDASNAPDGTVLLLPEDPDGSAQRLCARLRERFAMRLALVITDTMGRPWRLGQTDVAIGSAGIQVLDDLNGESDDFGRELAVTNAAIADEIAGAANLVAGKVSRCPVTLVQGLGRYVFADLAPSGEGPNARDLLRPMAEDLFSLGTREAFEAGRAAGLVESRAVSEATSSGDAVCG